MSVNFQQISKILNHTFIVHIYSSPNFLMETCVNILMCLFHCLLIYEINILINEIDIPPLKLTFNQSCKDVKSKDSIDRKVVRTHPQLGVDVVFKENNLLKNDWDTSSKITKMLSTSLSEYIRKDLRHFRQKVLNEGDNSQSEVKKSSLDKIYEYLFDEPTAKEKAPSNEIEKVERSEIVRLH